MFGGKTKNEKEAAKYFKKAAQLQNKFKETLSYEPREGFIENRFGSYYDKTLVEQVIDCLKKAIELDPNVDYEYSLGGVYLEGKYTKEAKRIYEKLLRSESKKLSAAAMLTLVHLDLGERAKAEEMVELHNKFVIEQGHPECLLTKIEKFL